MAGSRPFDEAVREEIAGILSRKYTTVRHGGHPSDRDEFLRERPFWPDMRFGGVDLADAAGHGPQFRITFTPVAEPEATYGYRIDVDKAAAAWSKRVGIRDPRQNPSMFAAELVWYMVAYIGAADITACPAGADGIRWINDGSDIFEKLPGTEEHA